MRTIVALAVVLLAFSFPGHGEEAEKILLRNLWPEVKFTALLSSEELSYLGLAGPDAGRREFKLDDISGDLVVLEALNTYCYGCRLQAPTINEAYRTVSTDPSLAGRVRFLGVAVGNNADAVSAFGREFSVPYPIVPDPGFTMLEVMGDEAVTPHTYLLRRATGGMTLAWDHVGRMASPVDLLSEIRRAMAVEAGPPKAKAPVGPGIAEPETDLALPIPEAEVERRVREGMERAGYANPSLGRLKLAGGETVWVGESGGRKVFSQVISRRPVCDVCHPVHFIIAIDAAGKVVDFDAILVTKYGNVPWTEEETASMRRKLVGLSALEEHSFVPEVDAVSRATMSSSLIFHSLGKMGPVYRALRDQGF